MWRLLRVHLGRVDRPRDFSSYIALMSSIIDCEPTSVEEAANQQVWRDAIMEKYHSIMKNNVWDIVSRPEGKRWWALGGSLRSSMLRMTA
jgi:hypothetical protein